MDRFDICEAYYLFFMEYHEGQWSTKYKRLCRMGRYFRPSPLMRDRDSLSEGAQEIYDALVEKEK